MKLSNVKWAEQHDWFVSAEQLNDTQWCVNVREWVQQANGEWEEERLTFGTFSRLKAWAGY